ncbi:hypothetical protein ACGFYQ_17825 [Streptomyces sp. NPDC048258]|uniref:hypothetical protein n=1 Tax=Streptomyces sp. NPDC048258 TaxID=3365527 RepID=UPI00372350A4
MNRHVRYALLAPLAPLVASAVALTPAMAAHAMPAAPAAAPQATCKLVVAPGTNPVEFDLVLTDFKAGQQVRVTGPENFTRTANQQGAVTEEDVKKGSYTARGTGGGNNPAVGCSKPPRTPATTAADISDVEVTGASTTPAVDVDCSVAQNVTFQGKITGTGTGNVKYKWSGVGKTSTPTVKFTEPSTATASFTVRAAPRAAPGNPAPSVTVSLTAGDATDSLNFTLKCKTGT